MITKIKIINFKSIKEATIELPFFGAIVGKNAVGKTNFIQALKFVSGLVHSNTTEEVQTKISLSPTELFNFNTQAREFSFEFTIQTSNDSNYIFNLKIELENDKVSTLHLIISEEGLYRIIDEQKKELIYSRDKNKITDVNNNPLPLSVDRNKIALISIKDAEEVKTEFLNLFIPDIDEINNINSVGIGSTRAVKNDLANVLVKLRHNHDEAYIKFQEITKKLLPHFSSVIEVASNQPKSPNDENQFYLLVLEEKNLKQKLSLQSISAGDYRTLYLVASALMVEKNSILIIEEIENGIHPKRIKDLVDRLETISRINNTQIIFTTHSPIVINSLNPTEVIYSEKDPEKGTQFILLDKSEEISKIKSLLEKGGNLSDFLSIMSS